LGEGVEHENRSKIEGNRRVATRDRTDKVMVLLGALRRRRNVFAVELGFVIRFLSDYG
jgi:hypothetical protein